MNPVPPQSYVDSEYIHKQTLPPTPQNTCRVPFLQLAKNILVKIEKDFSTKFWGKSWHFFWIALQTTKYDDRSAWPRLSLPRFHPDFYVPKNSPTLPPCGQGWARSSGQLHVTSPRENPWQIPSQWITTLQVNKETEFWELIPYAGKPILSMDQYKKNNLRYFVIKSSVSWHSAPWRHNLFLLTSFSVQHVVANKQNLCVCKIPKTIHFFKHTWKIWNLFPGVQEGIVIAFKNHLSQRLFNCRLSHTEEICFINNI